MVLISCYFLAKTNPFLLKHSFMVLSLCYALSTTNPYPFLCKAGACVVLSIYQYTTFCRGLVEDGFQLYAVLRSGVQRRGQGRRSCGFLPMGGGTFRYFRACENSTGVLSDTMNCSICPSVVRIARVTSGEVQRL